MKQEKNYLNQKDEEKEKTIYNQIENRLGRRKKKQVENWGFPKQ